ncbi:hypothetical protein GIB67_005603 [Kingdonia uniflora]|uniref:Piwi domain-containing protein n=1 Tax=Kingdonia uniflora TaxID=39325 RepID=A0A7J7NHU7_9MAGN|nr:hypothetical protein GIB67_005603 [Kingdonia uniflora]
MSLLLLQLQNGVGNYGHGPMKILIFGADATHPQPGEDSSPSIAAVVASLDWPEVTEYRALTPLKGILQGEWASESLTDHILQRHHTRFFTIDRNSYGKSGNIMPGTVVDTMICHPTEFDLYLCSHSGIHAIIPASRIISHSLESCPDFAHHRHERLRHNITRPIVFPFGKQIQVHPPKHSSEAQYQQTNRQPDTFSSNKKEPQDDINREGIGHIIQMAIANLNRWSSHPRTMAKTLEKDQQPHFRFDRLPQGPVDDRHTLPQEASELTVHRHWEDLMYRQQKPGATIEVITATK